MKNVIAIAFLFFSSLSVAENSPELSRYLEDLPKLLKQSGCIPARNVDGTNSKRCDQTSLEKNSDTSRRQLHLEPGDVVNRMHGKPVQSISQAMELYNSPPENHVDENEIKSCLSAIYVIQKDQYEKSGAYTSKIHDLLDNSSCVGITVTTNLAGNNEFKNTAQAGKAVWTIDQNNSIQEVR